MKTNQQRRDECLARAREIIAERAAEYSETIEDFIRKYGWEEQKVAHTLGHRFYGPLACPYCRAGIGSLADLPPYMSKQGKLQAKFHHH